MGIEKQSREDSEAAWSRKDEAEGIRCSICKNHITHSEREILLTDKHGRVLR